MDRYARTIRLKGTPKQVAWATDIRARIVVDAKWACRSFLASLSAGPGLAAQQKEVWAALMRLTARREAGWWIDHRNERGGVLLWRHLHGRD